MSQAVHRPNFVSDQSNVDGLLAWLSTVQVSRKLKNLERDFSDAVLLAEIIAHFLPRYINLSNFSHASSLALKRYNWETLQKTVLCHLGIQLTQAKMQKLANGEAGQIVPLILEVKAKIEKAIHEGRYHPSAGRRGRSASTSTSRQGSMMRLDQLALLEKPLLDFYSNSLAGHRSSTSSTAFQLSSARLAPTMLERDYTKDQLIEKLYGRIRYMEICQREKEERIQSLSRQVAKLLEIVCCEQKKHEKRARNGADLSDNSEPITDEFELNNI